MTQRLFWYRPKDAPIEDDRKLCRWFDPASPEMVLEHEGETWTIIVPEQRSQIQAVKKTIDGFTSIQLPKWWPFAAQHDAEGRCVFKNRTEAEESAKVARACGEQVIWDY